MAYVGVVELQRIHAILLCRTGEASTILDALKGYSSTHFQHQSNLVTVSQHLRFADAMFLRILGDLRAWDDIIPYLKRSLDGVEEFLDSPNSRIFDRKFKFT